MLLGCVGRWYFAAFRIDNRYWLVKWVVEIGPSLAGWARFTDLVPVRIVSIGIDGAVGVNDRCELTLGIVCVGTD